MITAESRIERYRFLGSIAIPLCLTSCMWLIKLSEVIFHKDLSYLGLTPLSLSGLRGIILMPFLHGNWQHLMTNTIPVIVLGTALYYFYRQVASRVMILTIMISGLLTWCGARGGIHIGASALVYGLTTFLIISGFIRGNHQLIAISLITIFLYGGFIWGIFPAFTEFRNVSWEGHLSGLVTGTILAIYYRKIGLQREIPNWEDDNDDYDVIDPTTGKPYWDVPTPDKDELTTRYHPRR